MRGVYSILFAFTLLAAAPARRHDRIRVPVWVEAGGGEGASGLRRDTLTARVGGGAATIGRILSPKDDLMLLIVADVSQDLTLVDTARRSLTQRIEQLPARVSVGVLRAQDGLKVVVDPVEERAPVVEAIQSLPVSGRAGLLDSVQTVASIGDSILTKANVRVAVLFVTDSDIRNYREDFTNPVINESDYRDMSRRFPDALVREKVSKLETALTALQTPVFIVHLDYRSQGLNEAYQAGLLRLAGVTGGASYFCRSQTEIPDAIDKAFHAILSQYTVEVLVPEGAPRQLNITLESPGRSLNYRNHFSN
jgi:hypothetical protein